MLGSTVLIVLLETGFLVSMFLWVTLLIPDRLSIGIDLDIRIGKASNTCHRPKVLKWLRGQLAAVLWIFFYYFQNTDLLTVSWALFSCMKSTTWSISFKEPAITGELARSAVRTTPTRNPMMKV